MLQFSNAENLSPLWLPLGLIFLYLGIIVLIAEGLNRIAATNAEVTRKIVHIGSGNVILLAWWLAIPSWVIMVAAFMASLIAIFSYFVPILPSINSVGRKSLGTFFYALSIGVLGAGLENQPQYAAIGILVMTWGDGMAAIIGQNWGKHPYTIFGSTKSWEGSFAMAIVSFLVTSMVLLGVQGNIWQTWIVALAVAIIATSLETFSQLGIDNLTVPLGSAAVGFFLTQILL